MNKIIKFNELQQAVAALPRPLVLVGGCFDILHLGHVRFLKAAKKHGTVLVALESDQSLKQYKGIARPIHSQTDRAEVLSSLETVDFITLLPHFSSHQQYFDLVTTIKPNCIAVTEGDPLLANKQKQAGSVGATIITVAAIKTPSTSQLVKLLALETV